MLVAFCNLKLHCMTGMHYSGLCESLNKGAFCTQCLTDKCECLQMFNSTHQFNTSSCVYKQLCCSPEGCYLHRSCYSCRKYENTWIFTDRLELEVVVRTGFLQDPAENHGEWVFFVSYGHEQMVSFGAFMKTKGHVEEQHGAHAFRVQTGMWNNRCDCRKFIHLL